MHVAPSEGLTNAPVACSLVERLDYYFRRSKPRVLAMRQDQKRFPYLGNPRKSPSYRYVIPGVPVSRFTALNSQLFFRLPLVARHMSHVTSSSPANELRIRIIL